jgi:hypothetical protein
VRTQFFAEHPDVALAFIQAHMAAQEKLLAEFDRVVGIASEAWKQPEIIAKTTLETYAETAGVRKAPFVLEWDVATVLKASEFLAQTKVRDKALTWNELKATFAKTAALQKRAWEGGPYKLSVEDMKKGFTGKTELYGPIHVNGGSPVWEWDGTPDWGRRVLAK